MYYFVNAFQKFFEQMSKHLWFATVTLLSFFQSAIATFCNPNHIGGLVVQTHASSAQHQRFKIIGTAAAKGGGTAEEQQDSYV